MTTTRSAGRHRYPDLKQAYAPMKSLLSIALTSVLVLAVACGRDDPASGRTDANGEAAEPASEAEGMPDEVLGETAAARSVEILPGLSRRILEEGHGATAEIGQTAIVHYTGWFYDENAADHRGEKFDSSVDRDRHFEFPIGAGKVIRGWDQGVVGMQVGEVRELTIAPELAYGDRGAGDAIPPGATLVFEVELAGLKDGSAAPSQ